MPRAERERQMIQIAGEVFAERGYAAASMDDIAERVGVSKPMLYEYFRSKEGLLVACIENARAALRRGLLEFFVFVRERRRAWSLLRHEASLAGTSAWDEIEATRRQQTGLIAKLMADFLVDKSPTRVEADAEFIVGACERLAIWCEQHEEVTPERATAAAMDLLWNGLAGRAR